MTDTTGGFGGWRDTKTLGDLMTHTALAGVQGRVRISNIKTKMLLLRRILIVLGFDMVRPF